MADPAAGAWQRITRELAKQLPGQWTAGRSGARSILVSRPDEWILWWVGLDRIRRGEPTYVIAGAVELVAPFALTYQNGLRSDESRRRPNRVDPVEEDAARWVHDFVVEDAVPILESWSRERLKRIAEDDFTKPPGERAWPMDFPSLAGWRIVEDGESPEEPARQAAEAFGKHDGTPDEAAWYRSLLGVWEAGGRPSALTYLEDQRTAALASLKLVQR